MREKGGFTLLELIIVIIILGILAATGLPVYLNAVERARAKEAYTIINSIREAEARWCAANASGLFYGVTVTNGYAPATGGLDIGWNTRYWNFGVGNATTGWANINATRQSGTAYIMTCNIQNTNLLGIWNSDHPGYTAP